MTDHTPDCQAVSCNGCGHHEIMIRLTAGPSRKGDMTLRQLLAYLRKQQGSDEAFQAALDQPLSIGVSDAHRNFDHAKIWNDYPHYRAGVTAIEGVHDGSPGMVRIDCGLTRKRMVEAKKD